ncbi:hypothetical protein BGZ83_010651 [Gryganskiella cystojenkinii]|nr:hypothetical protein BGZ83_010651 [Gryganskiella cystojenkinii]
MDFTASSPPLQDPDSGMIFETRLQLAVIENLIATAMANLTKYMDGQKARLEKKREVVEGMEAKLQERRKALGELRLATKKANELDQELGHASERVRVLAGQARDLGLAAEEATRIYVIIQAEEAKVPCIYKLDCVAMMAGTLYSSARYLESTDALQYENFCYPTRKIRGIALIVEEIAYNEIFRSFRCRIEIYFGEMQSTFTKFSHTVVTKVAEKETFGVHTSWHVSQ